MDAWMKSQQREHNLRSFQKQKRRRAKTIQFTDAQLEIAMNALAKLEAA